LDALYHFSFLFSREDLHMLHYRSVLQISQTNIYIKNVKAFFATLHDSLTFVIRSVHTDLQGVHMRSGRCGNTANQRNVPRIHIFFPSPHRFSWEREREKDNGHSLISALCKDRYGL